MSQGATFVTKTGSLATKGLISLSQRFAHITLVVVVVVVVVIIIVVVIIVVVIVVEGEGAGGVVVIEIGVVVVVVVLVVVVVVVAIIVDLGFWRLLSTRHTCLVFCESVGKIDLCYLIWPPSPQSLSLKI